MKFLRFLLILIGIFIVIVLVLGLIEPKDVTITRSTVINAPKAVVFEQIVKFKNWPHWSPWYEMEPTVQMEYFGTDGEPGSGYKWKGDAKKTGEGEMTNKGVTADEMNFGVHFIKPMDGKGDGTFTVTDTAGGTKVTWKLVSHMKYPFNALQLFMNMDKMVGKDFERGLQLMKQYCESHNSMPASGSVSIQETQFPGHTYAVIRKTVGFNDMQTFFDNTLSTLGKEAGPRITGPAVGIYYTWDTAKHQSDMAAGFPVSGNEPIKGATIVNVPASKADMAVHKGGYANMHETHMALMNYTAQKNQKTSLVLEEYATGAYQEKDSTKWVTNIYYLVQ